MKVNPTVALTLILLSLMLSAGLTSAVWGYRLGRESLKGVTQPNTRPINSAEGSQEHHPRGELTLLKEADILANVKAQIEAGGVPPAETPAPASP
jgi:hypothetical protein